MTIQVYFKGAKLGIWGDGTDECDFTAISCIVLISSTEMLIITFLRIESLLKWKEWNVKSDVLKVIEEIIVLIPPMIDTTEEERREKK